MGRNLIAWVSKTCGHRQADSGRIKPGSETVNNPDPECFRPQNQGLRAQNPKQTRPQPLWIGVREAGPPIRVQEARSRRSKAGASRVRAYLKWGMVQRVILA